MIASTLKTIEVVRRQGVVDVGHALVPAAWALNRLFKAPIHRKVGSPRQVGVRIQVKSLGMGTVHPRLAKHIKLRLKGLYLGHPLAQKRLVGVEPGVYAERVELGLLDPPEAVLNKVAGEVRVASVDVGHGTHKPTVHLPLAVAGRGIGIKQGLVAVNRSKGGSLFTAGLGPRIGGRRRRPCIEPG